MDTQTQDAFGNLNGTSTASQRSESLPEVFYESHKIRLSRLNGWLIVYLTFGVVTSIFLGVVNPGLMWASLIGSTLMVVTAYWIRRRKTMVTEASVVISKNSIRSSLFRGTLKEYCWFSIIGFSIKGKGRKQSLQLHLDKSLGFPDVPSVWTGVNAAFPSMPLSSFEPDQKVALYDSIARHLQTPPASNPFVEEDRQSAEYRALMARLKSQMPVPWVTYGLIAVNVLVWLATVIMGAGFWNTSADILLLWGGNAASEFQRGEWWRLLTAVFLHGGLMHVAMNMLVLASMGLAVERIYGHRLFLLIYLASGLIGSSLSLHYSAQHVVSVGASGAIFGVTGAFLVALYQHRNRIPGSLVKPQISNLALYILYAVSRGFADHGIDNAAHIGGLASGCFLAFILPERFDMDRHIRTLKWRTGIGIVLAAIAVSVLASTAPRATVDLKARMALAHAFMEYRDLMRIAEKDQQAVKSGLLSERDSDEKGQNYYAPRMRQIVHEYSLIQMMPSDPWNELLRETKHISELTLEAFEMPSVYKKGSDKPIPANPARVTAIEAEVRVSLQKLQKFLKDL